MSEVVMPLTDQEFEATISAESVPALVDFWAPWCGPCRALAPAVEAVAAKYVGKLKVYKVNVDENPKTAAKFGVRSIPTLILFRGGEVVDVLVGLASQERLEGFVGKVLPSP